MKITWIKTASVMLLVLAADFSLVAISPDQTLTEKILRDNRYFLEFANISVSNFGTEENVKQLKEANQRHFNANLRYLESNYVAAFREIRLSQEILRDLYYDVLKNKYAEDARVLLDSSAPLIIQAKDKKAEHFLRLGYRDLEVSRQFRDIGFNYNRFLYSNKIRYYIDGIKRARRAKRFSFLALIESKTPVEDKPDFQLQTLDDVRQVEEREVVADYERVKNLLTNQLNRKLYEDKYSFFLHHDDNYALISRTKKSILKDALNDLKIEKPPGTEPEPVPVEKKENKPNP